MSVAVGSGINGALYARPTPPTDKSADAVAFLSGASAHAKFSKAKPPVRRWVVESPAAYSAASMGMVPMPAIGSSSGSPRQPDRRSIEWARLARSDAGCSWRR